MAKGAFRLTEHTMT